MYINYYLGLKLTVFQAQQKELFIDRSASGRFVFLFSNLYFIVRKAARGRYRPRA